MTMTRQETGIRANLYRFLASSFLDPPTAETVELFQSTDYLAMLGDAISPEGARYFSNFISSYDPTEFNELKIEFDNLFRIPMGQFVTPYESIYCDSREVGGESVRGLLMGPSVEAVKHLYVRGGMEISPTCPYLPDYVGVEMSFMAHLCEAEYKALGEDREDEARSLHDLGRRFFAEHIQRWIPKLCGRMMEKTTSEFFLGLATLSNDFLKAEGDFFDVPQATKEADPT